MRLAAALARRNRPCSPGRRGGEAGRSLRRVARRREARDQRAARRHHPRPRGPTATLPEDASWAVSPAVRAQHVAARRHATSGSRSNLRTAHAQRRARSDDAGDHDYAMRPAKSSSPTRPAARSPSRMAASALRKAMPQRRALFRPRRQDRPARPARRRLYVYWNTDAFGYGAATDPIYKSIPFVIGLDESGRQLRAVPRQHAGAASSTSARRERDAFAFGAEGGPIDYYVMAGARSEGRRPGLRRPDRHRAADAAMGARLPAIALELHDAGRGRRASPTGCARDKIPADVIWLDIDYQDRNRPFTVDKKTFPDLPGPGQRSAARRRCKLVVDHRPPHRERAEPGLRALRQRHGGRHRS